MKKALLILGLLVSFIVTGLGVSAKSNQLHTITLEKNNDSYNVILDTDNISKVTRKVVSDDEIVLEISGITSSETVNALYKGTESIENLVIEKAGFNKLKIYITARNIKSASVIMQPVVGNETLVGETFPMNKVLWTVFVLGALALVVKRSIKRTNEDNNLSIKRDIKEREIALYRQYRRCLDEGISLTSKDAKIHNILKKIDRRIDERLSMTTK